MKFRPFQAIKRVFRILYVKAAIFIPFHFWCFVSRFRKHKKQSDESNEAAWKLIREIADKITYPPPEGIVVESSLVEVEV